MATNLATEGAQKIKMKKKKITRKQKDMNIKMKNLRECATIAVRKGNMSKDCQAWKYSHNKKFEEAERAIDGDENDVVLCLLMCESKNECKKVHFAEDVQERRLR